MLSPPWCCPEFSRSPRLAKQTNKLNKKDRRVELPANSDRFSSLSKKKLPFSHLKQSNNFLHFFFSNQTFSLLPLLPLILCYSSSQTIFRSASCFEVKQKKKLNIGFLKTKNNQITTWTLWEQQHSSDDILLLLYACVFSPTFVLDSFL